MGGGDVAGCVFVFPFFLSFLKEILRPTFETAARSRPSRQRPRQSGKVDRPAKPGVRLQQAHDDGHGGLVVGIRAGQLLRRRRHDVAQNVVRITWSIGTNGKILKILKITRLGRTDTMSWGREEAMFAGTYRQSNTTVSYQ